MYQEVSGNRAVGRAAGCSASCAGRNVGCTRASGRAVARELKRPLLELRQLALGFDGNGTSDEEIRAEMVSVTERAMRQVDDLVKIQSLGGFSLGPVAVRAVCDEAIDEIGRIYNGRTIQMQVRYSNRQRLVRANSELLKSIVCNFLMDAALYATAEMKTELKVREMGKKVAVEIRDFGPALPMEVWREIKDDVLEDGTPRRPNDIAMRPGSSALGLYIASKFSKYMQAEVSAVRHTDGASFIVKLPVARQMSIWGNV